MSHIKKEMLSFFITTRCNLRCRYCYNIHERERDHHTLPLDFAKAGVDIFFASSKSRHIRFYGPGEPTQAFDIMKSIYNYAQAHPHSQNSLTAEIQTNGVFDAQVREWLGENMNIIWMSFDGPPDIQDYNRPTQTKTSSSPIIEENVKWFCNNSKAMVGARVTMTDENIHRQFDMIDYFIDLGIKYIWTNPLFPSVETQAVCYDIKREEQYAFNMDTYVSAYKKAFLYAKEKGVFWGSFLTCNFDGFSKYNCRACLPAFHLTPDGYVSACDMVTSGKNPHHMRPFIFGKWDENKSEIVLYAERISELQSRLVDNMPGCKGCVASEHCAGYCLGEVLNETDSMFGKKPQVCRAIVDLYHSIGLASEPYEYLHP